MRTRGIGLDIKLRQGDHHRSHAGHGAHGENCTQLDFLHPIHLDFPQHDDGRAQQAEAENRMEGRHGEGESFRGESVAIRQMRRSSPLVERQLVGPAAGGDVDGVCDHVTHEDDQKSVIDPSPLLGREAGDAAIEEADGDLDYERRRDIEVRSDETYLHIISASG